MNDDDNPMVHNEFKADQATGNVVQVGTADNVHLGGSSHVEYNIRIGSVAGAVVTMTDRPDYRLEFRTPSARPEMPANPGPSYLLDAQREVVPFRSRPEEERRLRAWRDESGRLSVQLVFGPGGQGKTRLAASFATESYQAGWAVAQATVKQRPTGSGPDTAAADGQPLLVVVDYADRWDFSTLADLITSLPTDRTVRVLLLARPNRELWWKLDDELQRVAPLQEPVFIGTFANTDRAEAFADAVAAFQRELKIAPAPIAFDEKLTGADMSPLGLHMAALAAVSAQHEHIPRPAQRDLSRFLLGREQRYWSGPIKQVAFLATLFGPFEDAALARALLRAGRVADGEAGAEQAIRAYNQVYPPGERELLIPLRPDRFGEDFVAEQLDNPETAQANVEVVTDLLMGLADEQDPTALWLVRRCVTVLSAAAQRNRVVDTLLYEILLREPSLLPLGAHQPAMAFLD